MKPTWTHHAPSGAHRSGSRRSRSRSGALRPRARRDRLDPAAAQADSALSLLEVMVAAGVLAVLLMGFLSSWSAAATQRQVSQERRYAQQALADFVADRRSEDLSSILTTSITPVTPYTDVNGRYRPWGYVPAAYDASMNELQALKAVTATLVRFNTENPTLASSGDSTGATITAADAKALGFWDVSSNVKQGLDLNADGDTNDSSLGADDLIVLPAKVTVTWRSILGGSDLSEVMYVCFSKH